MIRLKVTDDTIGMQASPAIIYQGPQGPQGEKGEPGQVDYEKVLEQINQALDSYDPFAGGTVLLPEREYTTEDIGMDEICCGMFGLSVSDFVVGDSYTILFCGVSHSVECKEFSDGGRYLGNRSLVGWLDDNTGEPFCIIVDDGYFTGNGSVDLRTLEAGTYAVAIYRGNMNFVAESCIPSTIARTAQVDEQIAGLEDILSGKSDAAHLHDNRYYTETETDKLISTHKHSWNDLTDNPFAGAKTILKETEYTTEDIGMDEIACGIFGVAYDNFVVGETYKITFDGVPYEVQCSSPYDGATWSYLGNYAIAGGSPDTSEPFLIIIGESYFDGGLDFRTADPGTYTLGIYQGGQSIATETWTFELEDGTTVTKQVVVK